MAELCRTNVGTTQYGTNVLGINYSVGAANIVGNYHSVYVEVWIDCPVWISFSSSSFSVWGSASASGDFGTYLGAGRHIIWSGNIKVYHDSNGYGTLSLGASVNTTYVISGSVSGSVELPRILREASLTSKADITLNGKETTQALTFSNPGNYWLQLEYIWDGKIQIIKRIGKVNSFKVTFTQDELIKLYKRTNYTLRTVTHTNSNYTNYIGWKESNGNIVRNGMVNIYKQNWKKAIPFIYKNSKWNIAILHIYRNGWKKGK